MVLSQLPNPTQRQLLQRLRTDSWRALNKVRVAIGDITLARLVENGRIEQRGEGHARELRLTAAGLEALRTPLEFRR